MFDIISSFPNLESKLETIKTIDFKEPLTAIRDYIECSKNSIDDNVKPLSTKELLDSLQNMNENFSDGRINEFEKQINICNSMKNFIKPEGIQKWINEELKIWILMIILKKMKI